MAEWQPIPLGTESYQPRSGTLSVERLVNLYAEPTKDPERPFALYGTPGLLAWSTVGDGPIRGIHYARSYFWVVSGTELYAVNASTKAATLIGDIDGVGPVRMVHDATYVVICANIFSYAATLAGVVTLPEQNLIGVAYQDGYALYVQRNTQSVWRSTLDVLNNIPGTDFTSADVKSDNVVAVLSDQQEVWVFKEETIEVYQHTGSNAAFPFDRVSGGFIERGCLSPGSVAAANTLVIWLGNDRRVYVASGYNADAISTPAIDRMISRAYSPETAEAFVYSQEGHTFYVLTFANLTLCYDFTTGKWHERKSYGIDRWRVGAHAAFGDLNLVGNYDGNDLWELDLDTYDEDGEILEWQVIDPPLATYPQSIIVHEMSLDGEMGVGLTSGQGEAPVTLLSGSDDDGRTWSADIELSMGLIGEYTRRSTATRLGRSYRRSHRWRGSDPVKRVITGRHARIERLAA